MPRFRHASSSIALRVRHARVSPQNHLKVFFVLVQFMPFLLGKSVGSGVSVLGDQRRSSGKLPPFDLPLTLGASGAKVGARGRNPGGLGACPLTAFGVGFGLIWR